MSQITIKTESLDTTHLYSKPVSVSTPAALGLDKSRRFYEAEGLVSAIWESGKSIWSRVTSIKVLYGPAMDI